MLYCILWIYGFRQCYKVYILRLSLPVPSISLKRGAKPFDSGQDGADLACHRTLPSIILLESRRYSYLTFGRSHPRMSFWSGLASDIPNPPLIQHLYPAVLGRRSRVEVNGPYRSGICKVVAFTLLAIGILVVIAFVTRVILPLMFRLNPVRVLLVWKCLL